ncbi:MAG: paraquat-inducible protein A [Pseudomonadota bacterium]
MPEPFDIEKYWGCPSCDLLVKKKPVNFNQKASCPRCNKTLRQPVKNSIEKTLALATGALILFCPAIFFPLMTLNLIGFTQEQSIFQSIVAVFNEGHNLVAMVIFITCILVPMFKISILFYVSLGLLKKIQLPLMHVSFRSYHAIDEWGMLEIYMLAILVSIIKLESVAQLSFNLGLVLFTVFLLLSLLSSAFLDEELFWEKLGHRWENRELKNE